MNRLIIICITTLLSTSAMAKEAFLIIAHGSMGADKMDAAQHMLMAPLAGECHTSLEEPWEQAVLSEVRIVKDSFSDLPIEIAFTMWNKTCIQQAIQRLQSGLDDSLDQLYVIPLYISSHSSVIRMQEWILQLREEKALALMPTGPPFKGQLDLNQLNLENAITYTDALDYNLYVANILQSRTNDLIAYTQSNHPNISETDMELIMVMHGPVGAEDNLKWLEMGHTYLAELSEKGFHATHVISLRDDADKQDTGGNPEDKAQATRRLREIVENTTANGRHALIVPLFLAPSSILDEMQERLEGLDYIWTGETLLPDDNHNIA